MPTRVAVKIFTPIIMALDYLYNGGVNCVVTLDQIFLKGKLGTGEGINFEWADSFDLEINYTNNHRNDITVKDIMQ